MLKELKENKIAFGLSALAAVLGLVGIIMYGSTGIIRGFTDEMSPWVFVFGIAGLCISALNCVKRIDTLESLSFVAFLLAIICFLVVNANYLVAVTRAIDVTRVSETFVATIVIFAIAVVASLASNILRMPGKKAE